MRTTKAIIEEMFAKAKQGQCQTFCLVVGFTNHSLTISSTEDPKAALEKLNKFVTAGGTPLGFVFTRLTGDKMSFGHEPLAEFADEQVPKDVLRRVMENMARLLKAPSN